MKRVSGLYLDYFMAYLDDSRSYTYIRTLKQIRLKTLDYRCVVLFILED